MIDTNVLFPLTATGGGGGGSQVQANWNENDSTSKAYIQNRTHYEIPPLQTIDMKPLNDSYTEDTGADFFEFELNKTYNITIDGVEYNGLEPVEFSTDSQSFVLIGNPYLYASRCIEDVYFLSNPEFRQQALSAEDNGLPFCYVISSYSNPETNYIRFYTLVDNDEPANYTIKIADVSDLTKEYTVNLEKNVNNYYQLTIRGEDFHVPFTEGSSITISINGNQYVTECQIDTWEEEGEIITSPSFWVGIDEDHEFFAYTQSNWDEFVNIRLDGTTTSEQKIIFSNGTGIKQLDEKFIPNIFAKKEDIKQSDWSQNDEMNTSFIKNRTHYTELTATNIQTESIDFEKYTLEPEGRSLWVGNGRILYTPTGGSTWEGLIHPNRTTDIWFNGEKYTLTSYGVEGTDKNSGICVGNSTLDPIATELAGDTPIAPDAPFVIRSYWVRQGYYYASYITATEDGTHTLVIGDATAEELTIVTVGNTSRKIAHGVVSFDSLTANDEKVLAISGLGSYKTIFLKNSSNVFSTGDISLAPDRIDDFSINPVNNQYIPDGSVPYLFVGSDIYLDAAEFTNDSAEVSIGNYVSEEVHQLDAKFIPTAQAITSGDNGYTTGDQVYSYINTQIGNIETLLASI